MKNYIKNQIKKSYETKQAIYENEDLLNKILEVSQLCVELYRGPNKTMLAGNGGSAADAQHIAAELVGRYGFDRPSIPSLAPTTDTSNLTAIGNDYGFDNIFSRQVNGIGQEGDALFCLSTSGSSLNVIKAAEMAKKMGIKIFSITGTSSTNLKMLSDISITIPSNEVNVIQEVYQIICSYICYKVEQDLFNWLIKQSY